MAQIRPEVELSPSRPRLHHLRTRDGGHEVDLIAEMSTGSVVGIEIKATAAPGTSDAKHLVWMRDQLGERFLAGAVLHTGPQPFQHLGTADLRTVGMSRPAALARRGERIRSGGGR